MSSFTAPLLLEDIPGTGLWRVGRELEYHVGSYPSATIYVVPNKFVTDLASIPRFLWPIVGHPAGPYRAAAVLHDWLYFRQLTTRKRADAVFREAMDVLKVKPALRDCLFVGARLGGWRQWAKYAQVRRFPVV